MSPAVPPLCAHLSHFSVHATFCLDIEVLPEAMDATHKSTTMTAFDYIEMLPEVADVTDNSTTMGEFIGIRWNSCTFWDLSAFPVDALVVSGPPQKTTQMLESGPSL